MKRQFQLKLFVGLHDTSVYVIHRFKLQINIFWIIKIRFEFFFNSIFELFQTLLLSRLTPLNFLLSLCKMFDFMVALLYLPYSLFMIIFSFSLSEGGLSIEFIIEPSKSIFIKAVTPELLCKTKGTATITDPVVWIY